jgi:hypothetical protein
MIYFIFIIHIVFLIVLKMMLKNIALYKTYNTQVH